MPDYSIYILQETDLTVAGTTSGNGLDGVNQGDGSHMVGGTITVNSSNWIPIGINDDDADFADNDNNQTLDQDVTVSTNNPPPNEIVTFTAGTRVEAEYRLEATGSDGLQYNIIAFNFATGSNAYGTIEGMAIIGPDGSFPPPGTVLTVDRAFEGPSAAAATYAEPICFGPGTRIGVPGGTRIIDDLQVGDLVRTRESGAATLRWIGRKTFPAVGAFAPVVFAPGAIGNRRELRVSQQHRLRVTGWQAELFYAADAVWVPAKHFLDRPGVRLEMGGQITYTHLLLDGHRTLIAEGIEAESLHPGDVALDAMGDAARAEVLAFFPEMGDDPSLTAYPALRAIEARALASA